MTATQPLPTGTVTFLFTDIEGSTRAWDASGPPSGFAGTSRSGMAEALSRHDAMVREVATTNGGEVFSTAGDAFAIAFPTAPDGLAASVGIQLALRDTDWRALGLPTPLAVRMALHTGIAHARATERMRNSRTRVLPSSGIAMRHTATNCVHSCKGMRM